MYCATVEHAYQALKTLDPKERERIRSARTPGEAKKRGRHATLRLNWDAIRIDEMRRCLRAKFADPGLMAQLVATGSRLLVEGNHWGDRFWGVSEGQGKNWLGKLLMELRAEGRR